MKRDIIPTVYIMVASLLYLVLVFYVIDTETEKPIPVANRSMVDLGGIAEIDISEVIPEKPILCPDSLDWYINVLTPALQHVVLPTVTMVLTDIGEYWVTNYCPAECGGSWETSSGATCHRASYENRLTEPTTVAVDLSYWPYGTLFYIPAFDRVFIAEDTGSGVQGKWLDLFYEDYSDVVNFPVGYYQVYTVEYVYEYVPAYYYDFRPLFNEGVKEKYYLSNR